MIAVLTVTLLALFFFTPGTEWSPAALGIQLLGVLVEDVAGTAISTACVQGVCAMSNRRKVDTKSITRGAKPIESACHFC